MHSNHQADFSVFGQVPSTHEVQRSVPSCKSALEVRYEAIFYLEWNGNTKAKKFNAPSYHNHTKASDALTDELAKEVLNHEQRAKVQAGLEKEMN